MKRILVAEDEQTIREFVVINLERAGYETFEAANGEAALALYDRENGNFDIESYYLKALNTILGTNYTPEK